MKKRLAALALCLVFTGTLIAVPKARASLVGAGAAAVGAAVLATYMAASGLTINTDSAETITTGLDSLAQDYLTDTGSTETAESWLSTIAGLVTIPGAGVLQLPASVVRIIGSFTTWLTETFGLTEEGSEAVLIPGSDSFCSYNGVSLPKLPNLSNSFSLIFYHNYSTCYLYNITNTSLNYDEQNDKFLITGKLYVDMYELSGSSWRKIATSQSVPSGAAWSGITEIVWSNFDVFSSLGSVFLSSSTPVFEGQSSVIRGSGFTDIFKDNYASEADERPLNIFVPQTVTKPDDLATIIPDQIAAGTLSPTFELTQEGTGEGTDTDDPEEQTGIYIPALQRIQNTLSNLGQSIVDGIMSGLTSLFVPSEAYLEALPTQITETFEERTGFLTYPFSLLPSFVDRLSTTSTDWILTWPQISEPFSGAVLFQAGSYNVSQFMRSDAQFVYLYQLYRLLVKVFMSFGFLSLCYNKYRSVVGDRYGGS